MAGPPPMNVLLITCDQWRADALSCAGHPLVRTPCLDQLAAEGVRFANHYCQATPCGPSRAALYTGMYQLNNRVVANGTPLARRHTNIALELRRGGYDPVLSGYTDTAQDPSASQGELDPAVHYYGDTLPGMRSLNTVPGGSSGHLASSWVQWLTELGYTVPEEMLPQGPYGVGAYCSVEQHGAMLGGDPEVVVNAEGGQFQHAVDANGVPGAAFYKAEHSDTAFAVNQVISYVRSRRGQPWACHLSVFKPHAPLLAAAPFNTHYMPDDAGLPQHRAANLQEEGHLHPWLAHRLTQRASVAPEDDEAMKLLRSQYFAVCEEADAQLGRMFDALRGSNEWSNTMVVFTTDHGEQLGDHWLLNKDGFFEQSYHIPLIVKVPTANDLPGFAAKTAAAAPQTAGTVVQAFTEHVDLMPSILELVGLSVPPQADGRSLLPFLLGQPTPPSWRTAAHWEFDYRDRNPPAGAEPSTCSLCVLRGSRWKYVCFSDPTMRPLLFDMKDKDELVDLSGSMEPEHVTAHAECALSMIQWRMRHAEHSQTHLNLGAGGVVVGKELFEPTASL